MSLSGTFPLVSHIAFRLPSLFVAEAAKLRNKLSFDVMNNEVNNICIYRKKAG